MTRNRPFLIYRSQSLSRVLLFLTAMIVMGTLTLPTPGQAGDVCHQPPPQFPGVSSFKDDQGEWNDVDNPYFPLEPGTTFVYEGTKDEDSVRVVVRVTHKTKMIFGVRTVVVRRQGIHQRRASRRHV